MKTNKSKHSVNETFEGGRAANLTPKERLEHLVLACLLWEDTFYEDGKSIVEQIHDASVKGEKTSAVNIAVAVGVRHYLFACIFVTEVSLCPDKY